MIFLRNMQANKGYIFILLFQIFPKNDGKTFQIRQKPSTLSAKGACYAAR